MIPILMHIFGLAVFSIIAAFWAFQALRILFGEKNLPWVKDFEAADLPECPSVSLLFAARDEEEKLPAALETLAALDYPKIEIIGVDDRSEDATGRILDEFAAKHPQFRAVHITELPKGWLGKPHALHKAYEAATGEWLLFTDADVQFEPSVLRRAMSIAQKSGIDHLTLVTDIEMKGFWEKTILTFFGMMFHVANQLDRVNSKKTGAYAGIGVFQLLKRSVYEAIGTHRRLAMEVVEDMKLGKLVKQNGFHSVVGMAQGFVKVRWQSGARNVIRGVTKNFFAAFGYSVLFATAAIAGMLLINVAPFVGVFAAHGWIRAMCGIAVAGALVMHAGVDLTGRVSAFYALTLPLGAILFCYMIARSMAVTLWKGGVTWRGTFYPLKELKRGVV
ncbi:MAG TPA: glycosyltransferase family 2 protein [Candidatus Acidoferrum sp.]|nr:glycosyltransferase family 2 protein [Candidatus Acidoferrum sp.]